ncbi:amidohydrolase family domain protein [Mycobacterium xenopi 4042]|uniref:Amidohydrolase family domain protein n=1 Tax=Mycobacterium xenopi 4042 TaxID=1299334 RepID=X8AGZ2_MYCXE|nr:amidohydrolase family domain protein [Mycobacterium xenopi 4042]
MWLRIKGYNDQPDRVAFGDDAAVAGGSSARTPTDPFLRRRHRRPADRPGSDAGSGAVAAPRRRELIELSLAAVPQPMPRCRSNRRNPAHRSRPAASAAEPPRHRWRRQRRGASHRRRKALRLMLIQRATTLDGATVDVRVGRGSRRSLANSRRARRGNVRRRGGTVLPGLHDHHVHLYSAAAVEDSVRAGPRRCATATGWPARWPMPQSEATAGSGRSATTIRWPARWTERCSTPSRRGAGARTAPERRAVDPQLGGLTRWGGGSSRRALRSATRAGRTRWAPRTNLAELSRRSPDTESPASPTPHRTWMSPTS